MTPCENFQIDLLDSLGEPEASAPPAARAHLRACADCRVWLADAQAVVAGLREFNPADPGEIFFARQAKRILAQVEGESAFELEGEDLEVKALLLELDSEEPSAEFFPQQSQAILAQIQAESQRPRETRGLWKNSLLAAAALGLLCWGLVRFVPFQTLQTASVSRAVTPAISETDPEFNLEGLDAQELDQLATRLEKRFLAEQANDFFDEESDWEDLSESEIDLLIQRWQGSGRST